MMNVTSILGIFNSNYVMNTFMSIQHFKKCQLYFVWKGAHLPHTPSPSCGLMAMQSASLNLAGHPWSAPPTFYLLSPSLFLRQSVVCAANQAGYNGSLQQDKGSLQYFQENILVSYWCSYIGGRGGASQKYMLISMLGGGRGVGWKGGHCTYCCHVCSLVPLTLL